MSSEANEKASATSPANTISEASNTNPFLLFMDEE